MQFPHLQVKLIKIKFNLNLLVFWGFSIIKNIYSVILFNGYYIGTQKRGDPG